MPHSIDSSEPSTARCELPAGVCIHQFVRIEKWSEATTTENRITDDFGRKIGPLHHHRMVTTYEKYRCRLCGEEDIQSYTVWNER